VRLLVIALIILLGSLFGIMHFTEGARLLATLQAGLWYWVVAAVVAQVLVIVNRILLHRDCPLHEGRKYPIQHTRYEAVPGAPSSKGVGHSAGALFQITRLHRENPFPVHPAKALQARQTYRLPRQYLTYFHLSITAQCIQKGACLVYSLPVLCIRLRTVGNTPSHLEVSGSILNNKGPDHNT
jgi:hypothetical protein